MVRIYRLDKWKQIYLEGMTVNICSSVRVCVGACWLCHKTKVIVVAAAVLLCDNGGFQERIGEELGAPPTKTIC